MLYDTLAKCWTLMDARARQGLLLVGIMIGVSSFLEAIGIGIIFPFIKVLQDPSAASDVPVLGRILDVAGFTGGAQSLAGASALIFAIFLGKNIFVFLTFVVRTKYAQDNQVRLATRLLGGYVYSPYTLHLERNSAEVIRNLNSSAGTVFSLAVFSAIEILTEVLTVAAIFVVLLLTDVKVTLGASVAIAVLFLFFFLALPRIMRRYGRLGTHFKKELIQTLQQCLGAMKEIKVLSREAYFEGEYRRAAEGDARIRLLARVYQNAPRYVIEVVMVGGMLAAIVSITGGTTESSDVLATLAVFGIAAYRLAPSVNRILGAVNSINLSRAAVEIVYDDHVYFEGADAYRSAAPDAPAPMAFSDAIVLDGVSYEYPGADTASLADVDLTIRKGESIGIVGRTGAGKTTLVDLVLGLLTPTAGALKVDGIDVSTDLRAWQPLIGYVPQVIYLTDDSLRRNVALGIDDGEIDDGRLVACLAAAHLDEFVAGLPQGADTVVGELGVRLSGGQRQRIGIARSLYHDPQVLIMDEATSSLDSETERGVNQAIDGLRADKTVLIIAHRLSTVRSCDRLIYLEAGRIAGTGAFEDLERDCAGFRDMIQLGEISNTDATTAVSAVASSGVAE